MCGIVGTLNAPDVVGSMLDSIRHRGPDERDVWARPSLQFGHARLSIIDVETGQQPMLSCDRSVAVICNGEIYNFKDLRKELSAKGHVFKTHHSDVEVIVNGYLEWGVHVFEHLEGMFAVAIWDERRQRLILARDRFGIKPLVYAMTRDGGFLFASEAKAILRSGLLPPELNATAVSSYFFFRAPTANRTGFKGIQKLLPGSWIEVDLNGKVSAVHKFWRPGANFVQFKNRRQAEEEVLAALEASVEAHLVADVPVGVFLSGGVDSSLIAALCARHRQIDCFTVGTEGEFDETDHASVVARHLKLPLHVLKVSSDQFLQNLPSWSYINDDPNADPSALALMCISKLAKAYGMKVMLAGEGADELFGGYNSYVRYHAMNQLSRVPGMRSIGKAICRLGKGKTFDYLSYLGEGFFGTAHMSDLRSLATLLDPSLRGSIDEMMECLFHYSEADAQPLRCAMIEDQLIRLPDDILSRTDKATMAASLEARVPYLDRRVSELANSLMDAWCVSGKECKPLLKAIAARFVPPSVIYRKKVGFDLPVDNWLRGPFRDQIEVLIAKRALPMLNYAWIRAAYDLLLAGKTSNISTLWAWFVYEQWFDHWVKTPAGEPVADRVGAGY